MDFRGCRQRACPLVAALLAWSGGSPWSIDLLVAVVSTVSLVSAWLAGETIAGHLRERHPRAGGADDEQAA